MRRSTWLSLAVLAASLPGAVARAQAEKPDVGNPARPVVGAKPGDEEARKPEVLMDLHGDPLPPGAVARVGSVRDFIGMGSNRVAFSRDGKAMVATCSFLGIKPRLVETDTGRVLLSLSDLADRRGVSEVIAFSPDGERVVVAADRGRLRIGDVKTGRKLDEVVVADGPIRFPVPFGSLLYSADGTVLAMGNDMSSVVWLWKVGKGREFLKFDLGESAQCYTLASDGKTLAVGSEDGVITLIDVASRREVRKLEGHHEKVNGLAYSPDGRRIASLGNDNALCYWDVESGRELRRFPSYRIPMDELNETLVHQVSFSPDGNLLAAGGFDRALCIWDLRTGHAYRKFPGTTCQEGFALSPDGKLLVSGGAHFRLWDVESVRELRRETHNPMFDSVAFSPDGKSLVTGDNDSGVRLWDAGSGREIRRFTGQEGAVTRVAFAPDGDLVASASLDRVLRIWETATGREVARLPEREGGYGTPAFAPGGRRLATRCGDGVVRLVDPATGVEVGRFEGPEKGPPRILSFRPDGRLLAAGGEKDVWVWDSDRGDRPLTLGHPEDVTTMAYSPAGNTLATGDYEGVLRIWNVETGRLIRRMPEGPVERQHAPMIRAVAFSPDGRILAASGEDVAIRLFDTATGRLLGRFEGHEAPRTDYEGVHALAFSPDGKLLASASTDRTVLAWDVTRLVPRLP